MCSMCMEGVWRGRELCGGLCGDVVRAVCEVCSICMEGVRALCEGCVEMWSVSSVQYVHGGGVSSVEGCVEMWSGLCVKCAVFVWRGCELCVRAVWRCGLCQVCSMCMEGV